MQWHAEYRHQSNVTLSEHFSCLDWQVISEDKLHFDLVFTHHNKNTREEQHTRKKKKKTHPSHFKYYCFSQLISPGTAADNCTSFCLAQWMARFDVNTVIKNAKKTTKHIFINIQCHGGVIDSIINQVIFVASIGTSNTMTSIISPLKLHSLYSPLWLSNTLNHFSWEVFLL